MRLSERKIHLWSVLIQLLFYPSLGLFIFSYIKTHGSNLSNLDDKELGHYMFIAIVSMIGLIITGSTIFFMGFWYFVKLNTAPEYYKTLNIINGILLMMGGLGFSLLISLYLLFNE